MIGQCSCQSAGAWLSLSSYWRKRVPVWEFRVRLEGRIPGVDKERLASFPLCQRAKTTPASFTASDLGLLSVIAGHQLGPSSKAFRTDGSL